MALLIGVMLCAMTFSMKANAATPDSSTFSEWEWEVMELVNRERYNEGLQPLVGFALLQEATGIRAEEIGEYWSHNRPDGSSCFSVLSEVGITSYRLAGENIARGYNSPDYVMYGWMNSDGHRSNILGTGYQYIGVGYEDGYQWTQMFLGGGSLSSLNLVLPDSMVFVPGTEIEDMGIYATISSTLYGTCYLPILPEYCSGFDSSQLGTQTVTVSVLGFTKTFEVTLKNPVPEKPYKIVNVVSGVHVYWKAVDGVSKYGVWRSESGINGTYKWIANPTVPHYTDTSAESGKTYYYRITCMNTSLNVHYEKSEAVGITYVATPDLTLRVNRATGIGLGWNSVEGATGYAIYRKTYSGGDDWVRVATITDPGTTTWDDTGVKAENGSIYKYTIRALAGSNRNTLSGCRAAGRTMVRLTSRTLNSAVKTSATSVKCTWSTTTQANGYEVRFMVGNSVYKTYTVGNYATGVKTFTGLEAGQTYKIQVRSYKKVEGVGCFYSAWSTAKTVTL